MLVLGGGCGELEDVEGDEEDVEHRASSFNILGGIGTCDCPTCLGWTRVYQTVFLQAKGADAMALVTRASDIRVSVPIAEEQIRMVYWLRAAKFESLGDALVLPFLVDDGEVFPLKETNTAPQTNLKGGSWEHHWDLADELHLTIYESPKVLGDPVEADEETTPSLSFSGPLEDVELVETPTELFFGDGEPIHHGLGPKPEFVFAGPCP